MLQHLHKVSNKFCIRYNMKFKNEDVETSKISPVNLFTLLY